MPVYDEFAGLFVHAEHVFAPLVLYSPVPQATQLLPDNLYDALHEILIVPPLQAPQPEQPVQELVPTVEPPEPPVKFPVHVWVEPLYEHVPLVTVQERVHDCVDVVFLTPVHAEQELPATSLVK